MAMKAKKQTGLRAINPEWWLLLSLFVVSAVVALVPFGGRMLLFLYVAPVMIAAFVYGKRHTILTSVACVLMVVTGPCSSEEFSHGGDLHGLELRQPAKAWAARLDEARVGIGPI